jgi:hypothetical protein
MEFIRCRLIASRGCRRSQWYSCSLFKAVRELGTFFVPPVAVMPQCTLAQNGETLALYGVQVYTRGMRVIPWEDSLCPEQRSLLVGCLLGDGRLECRSKAGSARLRIHHADQQRDYVFWKYNLLKPWVDRFPWKTTYVDKRNGEAYVSWFFHTRTLEIFKPWWQFFYPDGAKILPETIGQFLDPMALAVWFMDDGCFREECIILNTQSFSLHENKFLRDYFIQEHGVRPIIQKDRRNVRLYFGKSSKEKLLSIIRPFLLSTFYKIIPVTTDPNWVR